MIVLVADAFVLAVLALTAWAINGAHLPVGLLHEIAADVIWGAVTAVVTVIALAELTRFHTRRAARTNTTGGNTHA